MEKQFEIEWPDEYGEDWMGESLLLRILSTYCEDWMGESLLLRILSTYCDDYVFEFRGIRVRDISRKWEGMSVLADAHRI